MERTLHINMEESDNYNQSENLNIFNSSINNVETMDLEEENTTASSYQDNARLNSLETSEDDKSEKETDTPSVYEEMKNLTNLYINSRRKRLANNNLSFESQLSDLKTYVDQEIADLKSKLVTKANKESQEDRYIKSLEERISFLQKELLSKDRIITSLVETQNEILRTFSNIKNQHVTNHNNHNLNQKTEIENKKDHNKHFEKKLQPQKNMQQKKSTLDKEKNPTEITTHVKYDQQLKTLYIGNINPTITENDLYDFFGLRKTAYLEKNCYIDLIISGKTGTHRGYAFLTAPSYVCQEISKLDGVELQGNKIVIEMNRDMNIDNRNRSGTSHSKNTETDKRQENANVLTNGSIPIRSNKPNSNQPNKNFAIFCDSIPNGMKMKELNKKIDGSRVHLKAFTGAKTTQLERHMLVSLDEYTYDGAIIHAGINDILRGSNEEITQIPDNLMKIVRTCQSYNIGKIFISGIVPNKKTDENIEDINNQIKGLCLEQNIEYINPPLITEGHFWRDGTHLLDSGKVLLANKFADAINNYNFESNFL